MLMLGIYTAPGGALLLDASSRVTGGSFATAEHGFADLTATIRMPLREAFTLYERNAPLHVAIYAGADLAWEGRLEDGGLRSNEDGTAFTLTALGYASALRDAPYTALWSNTSVAEWRVLRADEATGFAYPDRYEFDDNNRLYISPRLNSVIGNFAGGNYGAYYYYQKPSQSSQQIVGLTFTYTVLMPSGWKLDVDTYLDPLVYQSTPFSLTATGVLQTGSGNITFTGRDALAFRLSYPVASATHAAQTGDFYIKITSIRIRTTTSATVYADEIARALVAFVSGINPLQLSSSTALIQSPLVDLQDEIYEDEAPADILNSLAARGDSQTPPARWEWGVWEDRRLHFQPRGTNARAWYVDITALELERTLDALYNSAYAVYEDASNRTLRTATATDTTSLAAVGITRRQAVGAKTTSATNAGRVRDTVIANDKEALLRAQVTFSAVYTASGGRAPLWQVRAGDTITIRNLPVTLGPVIDRIRTFRISRTTFDTITGALAVEPEAPLPTVSSELAQR